MIKIANGRGGRRGLLVLLVGTLLAEIIETSFQQVNCRTLSLSNKDTNGNTKRDNEFFARPGVPTREILEARGYRAEDIHFRTKDGYMLRITRGWNPLISKAKLGLAGGRTPILFVHGILESYNSFVINSFDVRPSDFSNITLSEFDLNDAIKNLGDVPSAKALPLLAMDFGHEVFIFSRRGFPGSQKLTGDPHIGMPADANANISGLIKGPVSSFLGGLASLGEFVQEVPFSFDPKFWNFSLDEQAEFDFPQAVDVVRNRTGADKIAVVGHSAGGALALMSLSLYPKLNEKLSALVLWSQAFSLGQGDFFNFLPPFLPLLKFYRGSLPPAFLSEPVQNFLGVICKTEIAQKTICEALFDIILGYSGGQQPMRPEFINSVVYPTSSHELSQLIQNVVLGGQMHTFNINLKKAKPYDLSKITNTRMSFYTPANDFLVSPNDVRSTLPLLNVPYNFHLIQGKINHNGYFWHKDTSRLAIIPSLYEIHQLTARQDEPVKINS